ncbi:MAG: beta-L-arabinofuranosidase domain-containing protein, partial [Terriglobia bacterium]
FSWLKLGEVKPSRWIKAQMARDLAEGFAGHLQELAPEVGTDIFGSGRNTPEKPNFAAANAEEAWWNGESEGNWRTGYIMMAYLSGDTQAQQEADAYVQHILETQDSDGYIGVYSPQLRYSQSPRNGELWTQTCILRGLLAYYELTGKPEVLHAVERAVQCSMGKYGPGKMTVFCIPGEKIGGILHGLMFMDVLERLFDLTGNPQYRDFGVWMYQDFCASGDPHSQDMRVASLLDLHRPWIDHGPHTYEFLRSLLWAYYSTGDSEYHQAYENALTKLQRYELPSGAAIAMESIEARRPDPTEAYYEYCAIKELLTSLVSGLQKTGVGDLGDSVEKILFNAAEGARAAHGKEITYCTRDNRYAVDGAVLGRDKFSPAHSDLAVCCNPNAVQIFPLYVRGMWMRTPDDGLAALLYGPSSVETKVKGVEVRIDENTDYPFSSVVSMLLSPQEPADFSLVLRNPHWSNSTQVTCPGGTVTRKGDYFMVHKRWTKGDRVKMEFNEPIVELPASNGELYLQRGPLVYALKIPARALTIKKYKVPGFADLAYLPVTGADWFYALDPNQGKNDYGFAFKIDQDANLLYPFDEAPVRLEGRMINLNSGKGESVSLIPMGSSLASLRRVTFPLGSSSCLQIGLTPPASKLSEKPGR